MAAEELTMTNSRQRDEQETRNTAEVMTWIEHLASQPDLPIDLDLICHINRLTLFKTDRDYWAGRVRSEVDWQQPDDWTRRRAIVALDERGLGVVDEHSGELLVQFPPDRAVGSMVEALLAWINSDEAEALHPVVRAALFHQRFTAIHPFRDGNGRSARALTTLLLWRAGFPAEILVLQRILDERRDAYVASLREADRGRYQQWVQFFAQAVLDALNA
jgi:Fic family protein